ncbi:hypothetical protein Peur_065725 [Populus x canadensis]
MGVRGVRRRGKEKKKRREGEKTKIERGREEIISPNHQHPVPRRGRLREFGLAQEMLSAYHNVGGDMKQVSLIFSLYWKLSLLVYPDKCSHPHAHQAFVKLNKALKELHSICRISTF